MRVDDIVVEQWELRSATEGQLRDLHDFADALHTETRPDDPRRPFEDFLAAVRTMPETYEVLAFVTRDAGGAVTGWAEGVAVRSDDNTHMSQAAIDVRPDARRRGIGRALLEHIADFAAARGRSMLIGVASDRVPAGDAFARRIGADAVHFSHTSRLDLAALDRERVERWIVTGPERAPGYRLTAVDGPYPDDLVGDIASVLDAMNDAPSGDIDMHDQHTPVELLREKEHQLAGTGTERWAILARHDASGAVAGLTEVMWNPTRATIVGQGETCVVAGHRGHALGKWMKAAMLRRIVEERPQCTQVRTSNADGNEAMVAINTQLGFQPHTAVTTWQVPVARVRAYLAAARVSR